MISALCVPAILIGFGTLIFFLSMSKPSPLRAVAISAFVIAPKSLPPSPPFDLISTTLSVRASLIFKASALSSAWRAASAAFLFSKALISWILPIKLPMFPPINWPVLPALLKICNGYVPKSIKIEFFKYTKPFK